MFINLFVILLMVFFTNTLLIQLFTVNQFTPDSGSVLCDLSAGMVLCSPPCLLRIMSIVVFEAFCHANLTETFWLIRDGVLLNEMMNKTHPNHLGEEY